MTSTFGDCRECGEPAVVKLNHRPLCQEHYDDELGNLSGMLFRALEHDEAGT